MKRILRVLLNVVTALLLLLFAGVASLRALNSPRDLMLTGERSDAAWLTFEQSSISLTSVRGLPIPDYYVQGGTPRVNPVKLTLVERDFGAFACVSGRALVGPWSIPLKKMPWEILRDFPYWRVTVPNWIVMLGLGFFPAIRLGAVLVRRIRVSRRRGRGLCLNCGYDIRATPARCPESGAAPKNAGAVSN